jgi:hypothetical protein
MVASMRGSRNARCGRRFVRNRAEQCRGDDSRQEATRPTGSVEPTGHATSAGGTPIAGDADATIGGDDAMGGARR